MGNKKLRPACACYRSRGIRPGTWAWHSRLARRWPSTSVTWCITHCRSSTPNGRRSSTPCRNCRARRAATWSNALGASTPWCSRTTCHFQASATSAARDGNPLHSNRGAEWSTPQWAERHLLVEIPAQMEITADIVDVKNPRVQAAAELGRFAEQLLTVVPADRLLLCPSYGLCRRTVELALAKVTTMIAAARSS